MYDFSTFFFLLYEWCFSLLYDMFFSLLHFSYFMSFTVAHAMEKKKHSDIKVGQDSYYSWLY